MMRLFVFLAALAVTPAFGQALVLSACGTGNYPVGSLHQLTEDPAGYLCVSTTTLGTRTNQPVQAAPEPKSPDEPKK